MFRSKPRYSLAEINEYIALYEKLNTVKRDPEDFITLDIMREVIDYFNRWLLKQEGK